MMFRNHGLSRGRNGTPAQLETGKMGLLDRFPIFNPKDTPFKPRMVKDHPRKQDSKEAD
jgi:hypothetical protein